ncbi:MAG TPA: A/G-specific adenine glycosylase [Acidimicrobiales bacterium]
MDRETGLNPRQRDLLAWGERHRRDLPWRHTRDPWAVLVSELMLQQTQVPRVVPRYEQFMEQFPSPAACAARPAGDVVAAWSGLGYNRRAVNLHRGAVAVCEHHDGRLPDDLDALLALPGIGPYTARAVLVFAFERDLGLVDTNAGRFVARALVGAPLTRHDAQARADAEVPPGRGWEWGQTVFDLGATVCTKRDPACERCPIAPHCAWRRAGYPEPDPISGSAGISRPQSTFGGSFRQGRGRLLARLTEGPLDASGVALCAGWPDDPGRAALAAASLVRDGLAVEDADGSFRLP